jgi:hypothetical protein
VVAAKVIHFAKMMMMDDLMAAASNFLQTKTTPKDVFVALDLWILLEEKSKTADCLKV